MHLMMQVTLSPFASMVTVSMNTPYGQAQHNDAGTVTITNDEENIYVTYNTNETADLGEVHVYVWTNINDIPTRRPASGHADYVVEDINSDFYVVTIPADIDCDNVYYISTHAALIADDSSDDDETGDGNNDGETAYAGGNNVPDGFPKSPGAWWGYVTFTFVCCEDEEPPVTPGEDCETAFAFGDMTLIETGATTNRWGWQVTVSVGDNNVSTPIYAGAGQNVIANGTHVGNLVYSYDGETLTVEFHMFPGFNMDETHVYAGNTWTTSIAPGLYGNQHDLDSASTDSYSIQLQDDNDGEIFIVAHAVVCGEY